MHRHVSDFRSKDNGNVVLWKSTRLILLLLLLVPLILFAGNSLADPLDIAPGHDLVLKDDQGQPTWMQLWESGRESARVGAFEEAAASYRALLQKKPKIEEALREYVLVLMTLDQWEEATIVVHKLLEIDAESSQYQLYAGRIALRQKRYEQASTYFGQVYTLSPSGPYSIEALKGVVLAMQKLDHKELAYPLMEQLYLRVPHEEVIVRQLAQYSMVLGYINKAMQFYRILFDEFGGNDQDFLAAAPLFEQADDLGMAVRCWHSYLETFPYYLLFHQKLSQYYLTHNQERSALPHLLVRLAHKESTPDLLLQIGHIYLYQESRPDKALYYYEEYRSKNPGNREVVAEIERIQAVLANDLLVIVENEGAWPLWRDLAKIAPNRLAIYSSMAEQLEEMGKEKELLEVLEIIHTHDPDNQKVSFKLAQLYFGNGNLTACEGVLDSLKEEERSGKDYFFLRSRIEEERGNRLQALTYYKLYFQENTKDYSALVRCLKISGDLGLISELDYFFHLLPEHSANKREEDKGRLQYGEALILNGLPSTARLFYQELLEQGELDPVLLQQVEANIVKTLQLEEKIFEAEQELMLSLVRDGGEQFLITQLIETALLDSDWDRAWKWYEFLVFKSDSSQDKCDGDTFLLFNEKINILQKSGQIEVAIEMTEDFLESSESLCREEKTKWSELTTTLAELYYKNDEYQKSKITLETLAQVSSDKFNIQVLEQAILCKTEKGNAYDHLLEYVLNVGGGTNTLLLDTALLLKKYGDYEAALFLVLQYLEEVPNSLRGRLLKAQLLVETGDDFAALAFYREIGQEFPDEKLFQKNILEIQFQLAKFNELIQELAPEWKPFKKEDVLLGEYFVPPAIASMPIWKQLLLARTFWAVRRWDDSLLVYESLLQPPVDQQFTDRIIREDVQLTLPPQQRTFWNVVTFTSPAEPDRLTVVMSPGFIRENLEKTVVAIAADFYPSYRWQQAVSKELSVRKAMRDGNYYQAMKEYQNLLQNEFSTESLFDLAGIYSRLGFLGKEAALYEIMKKQSPGYPDLDEALQRNAMKRKPRATLLSSFMEKSGREGYYDNRQLSGGWQGWFMPSLRHEVLFDWQRIYNNSDDSEQTLWRNRLQANMKWSPVYDLDFLLGLGADRADDQFGTTALYSMEVKGRVGDMVQGYLGVAQDVVDDTVESLQQQINKKEYEAGLTLDFLPRLFGGGGYLFTEYSDGNHQNKYDLWTSYILHSEPTLLQFRYGYEFSHNSDGNLGRDYSYENGFVPGDHPYWSPKEYWQHLFTISFEHQLAENILGRSAPSYYSLEYSFGYEFGGYDNHQIKAKIFLEISRHFLLDSTLAIIQGDQQREQNLWLSLIYRW
ncbi:MAG: hypothetical protein KKE53_03435 [Proteobacteria bacterium]|nr:hypothetical protein [Pseudomonadota bacterium]